MKSYRRTAGRGKCIPDCSQLSIIPLCRICLRQRSAASPVRLYRRGLIFLIFQNISRLAFQRVADGGKCGKADSRYFIVFDF